ncbi:MAG: hypothetical protein AB7F59_11370 [Bdellovibrionales bacterium]
MMTRTQQNSVFFTICCTLLASCGDGPKKTSDQIIYQKQTYTHAADQCPNVEGEYVRYDGSDLEYFEITKTEKGLKVIFNSGPDSYETEIDGTSRIFTEPAFYTGYCMKNEVFIQYYDINNKIYAQSLYFLNEQKSLITRQENFDEVVAENGFDEGSKTWIKREVAPPQTQN